jgi:hypothetical protein
MGEVRLHHVDQILLEQFAELGQHVDALTGGDRQ